MLRRILLRRIGTPEEVTTLVELLASDKARKVTRTTFLVDGRMISYPSYIPSFDLGIHQGVGKVGGEVEKRSRTEQVI